MSDDPAAAAAAQADPNPDPAPSDPNTVISEPWYEKVEDADLKGYIETKGWKTEADAVRSYRNLEKLRGVPEDRLLKLPEDPADMGAVWDRLGRPEAPDKYTAAIPEDLRDGIYDRLAGKAHEAGLTDGQFKALQEEFATAAQEVQKARQSEYDAEFQSWQGENPAAYNKVKNMLSNVGASAEDVTAAMNGDAAAFYSVLAKVAARTGESEAVHGDGESSFEMSADAAQAKIDAMMADKAFLDRLYHNDPKVREVAAREKRKYHMIVDQSKNMAGGSAAVLNENARLKAELRRRA